MDLLLVAQWMLWNAVGAILGAQLTRCDVVIVNFNAGRFLKDAVESVLRSRLVAHIHIVDNASTDGSLDLVLQGHDDRLTIIRNTTNLGFATACNFGLTRAACENILVLNPDCQVMEAAIDRLIAVLRSTDRVGMVGPLLLNADGSEQPGGRRKLPTPRRVLGQAMGRLGWRSQFPHFLLHQDPLPERPVEVEAISGACMMVRREMIAHIGPLDEEYFLHCEDLDWCMRASRRGWKVLFVPDAKVVHHKGVSSQGRLLAVEYYKHKGMVRFYGNLLSESYPRWLLAMVTAGVWARFGAIAVRLWLYRGVERMRSAFASARREL
jgi:GT2 family glycosyltransferase